MLLSSDRVRPLGPADVPEFLALAARDPVVNVFADYRARTTKLDRRWLGGQVVGRFVEGRMVAALHIGANLVPIQLGPNDVESLAEHALRARRTISTIVGPSTSVEKLWAVISQEWGTPREIRPDQPHMEMSGPALISPDPAVRRSQATDIDLVYPACVAMYTEEVGLSPEAGGGRDLYRTRVKQLISRGWQFARFEAGRVIFKAEVACVSPYAAQIQGVYVVPDRRGEGLASHGMAAVAEIVRAEIAPVASLYVNEHNVGAQKAYLRAGFVETRKFTTIMF